MEIFDIHTHRIPAPPFDAIWNFTPKDLPLSNEGIYCSAGIHPWYVNAGDLQAQEDKLTAAVLVSKNIVALGEAGLDKTIDVPWDLQLEAFQWQIKLGDVTGLPLILHVVKAHNEVLELKKRFAPRNSWIVHGFRGKKELAEQYIREGFYLSFGYRYNEEALRVTPANKMFFETDDAPEGIRNVYERAAGSLGIQVGELESSVQRNIGRMFFNA